MSTAACDSFASIFGAESLAEAILTIPDGRFFAVLVKSSKRVAADWIS